MFFNEPLVLMIDEQKRLGMILDSVLNFLSHLREKIVHVGELGSPATCRSMFLAMSLDQMHKMYVRPHFDYGDIIKILSYH